METRNLLFSDAFKAGSIIGGAGILLFILLYILGIQLVGILKPILLLVFGLAINIVILVILLKKFRVSQGGYINFVNAFLFGFIALAIATLLVAIFNYFFNTLFDPDYMKNTLLAQKDWMENYMSGKATEEQIASQLEKIDEQISKIGSVSQAIKGFGGNLLFGAIIALIVGAIMQKKPDIFDNSNTGGVI
jgi:hypothetical protein